MDKKWVMIPDVLFFQEGPGVRNSQYTNEGVKLINVANLVDGKVDLSTSDRYISEDEAYGKYSHFLCDEGDFIVASSGIKVEYIDKKMGFIDKSMLPLCMNTSTIRFKVLNPDELRIRYFMYYLKSMHFKGQLFRLITGSAQLNYGPSHLKQMQMPLIDIGEQDKIINRLDRIQRVIEARQQELLKFDELIKARFVEMFDKCSEEVLIGNVISICRGASPRPIQSFITDDPDGVNWIKIGDVSENSIYITQTAERITKEGAKKSRIVHRGDFILSNSMSFGRPYILGIEGCVHDGWLILSDFRDTFDELYLYHALRSEHVQHQFSGKVNGATVKNLNSDLVKETYIKVPEMKEQEAFADFVKQADKSKVVALKAA